MLSASILQQNADLLILSENDAAAACYQKFSGSKRIPELNQLNAIIAYNMASNLADVSPQRIFQDI